MLWVRPFTVGEGNNKHALAPVRGAKGGSGKHFPFRIIPERGQIPQDDLHATGEHPPDVFDDCVPGADFPNKSCVVEPQAAARALPDSRMFSSVGDVLTGETAAEHVHGRQFGPVQRRYILIYGDARPVPGEYRPAKRVDLAKPLMFEARPVKTEVA